MTENEVIVASPAALENFEPLEFLRELIGDGLQRNETLFRTASAGVVDLLENSIRVGFYLSDAKSYLAGDGNFIKWLEENFEISYPRANQLHRLSKHFSRDLIDSQQRARLGIQPKGLDAAIGPHVRNQITATGAKSLSDLFRVTGILPPLAIQDSSAPNGDREHASPSRFKQLEDLLETLEKRAKKLKANRLSSAQREKLITHLKPLVNLYSTLTSGMAPPEPSCCRFRVDDFR
jgi:hypothetical protein